MEYIDRLQVEGRDANPFFNLMGIEVVSFGDGEAELAMEVRDDMLNGVGWLQGGVFTALGDEAMALALYTVLGKDESIATISETTTYLRGAKDGRIRAKGRVIKRGRKIAFTEAEISTGGEEDGILSQTSASFAILTK